jgi:DNA-binding protein H-NS
LKDRDVEYAYQKRKNIIAAIAEYKELLKAEGIDLADLVAGAVATEKTSKREPRPAKYKYTTQKVMYRLGLAKVVSQYLSVKALRPVKL